MSSRPIRFFHRGAVVEVDGVATTRTVLDWLREDARCTGTKEGCNEGDCGACTVVVGALPGPAQADSPELVGGHRLTTANACIQFLPTLDGKALFTVEDLKAGAGPHPVQADELHPVKADELHPVQRAMVECDGSQCGFCTPGFVMSLWATYQHHGARGSRCSGRDCRRARRRAAAGSAGCRAPRGAGRWPRATSRSRACRSRIASRRTRPSPAARGAARLRSLPRLAGPRP